MMYWPEAPFGASVCVYCSAVVVPGCFELSSYENGKVHVSNYEMLIKTPSQYLNFTDARYWRVFHNQSCPRGLVQVRHPPDAVFSVYGHCFVPRVLSACVSSITQRTHVRLIMSGGWNTRHVGQLLNLRKLPMKFCRVELKSNKTERWGRGDRSSWSFLYLQCVTLV